MGKTSTTSVIEVAILAMLRTDELHGYAIVQKLKALGTFVPTAEGTVYPVLARLEDQGLIASRWEERRKLYLLTKKGATAALAGRDRWQDFCAGMAALFAAEAAP